MVFTANYFMKTGIHRILVGLFLILGTPQALGSDYVCVDFFPDREIVLGTGKRIFPPSFPAIRVFRLDGYSFPIKTTISIADADQVKFLVMRGAQIQNPIKLEDAKEYLENAIAGGMVRTEDGVSKFFLMTNSEILFLGQDGVVSIHSGEDIETWIITLKNSAKVK